jgi:hypothetical protein
VPKFKIKELNRLTNAYSYNGNGYSLKITYDENDDKCIEIENTLSNKICDIENKIVNYKHDLTKTMAKINKKQLSKLNFMDLAEVEEIIDNMKYYIREYHGLKGDL